MIIKRVYNNDITTRTRLS